MSRRRILNKVRCTARACWRGLILLAVGAKLLIPIGYMPAALADGGPVALCGSGLPAALAMQHDHAGNLSHDAAGHGQMPSGPHVAMPSGDHATSGHEYAESGAAQGEAPTAEHHEWERCSLGGLASLAAIASEWTLDLPARASQRAIAPGPERPIQTTRPAFRSRAPPIAIS